MNPELQALAAHESVNRLASRLAQEKQELVRFLLELADFDREQHALRLGYPSTLGCLVGKLGLTESSACRRIGVARMLARVPAIAPYLVAHRLTLMGVLALKEVLDEANAPALLECAAGLSEPAVRELVTRLRMEAARQPEMAPRVAATVAVTSAPEPEPDAAAPVAAAPALSLTPAPASDERSPLTLWVGAELRHELAAVRDLVSHAVPSGKAEDVLLYALREVRRRHDTRRYGAKQPRSQTRAATRADGQPPATPEPAASGPARHVPVAVRREVDDRDQRSCTFVGAGGKRCGSTWQLELQHQEPHARGGPGTVANLSQFCRAHNQFQAKQDFGEATIAARIEAARASRRPAVPAPAPPPNDTASPHAADVVSGLVRLGFKKAPAQAAVATAETQVPAGSELTTLLRESLSVLNRHRAIAPA